MTFAFLMPGRKRLEKRASRCEFATRPVLQILISAALVVGFDSRPVAGYTFLHRSAWDAQVWAPGASLSFTLVVDPEWERSFLDRAQLERVVTEALAFWSSISTADIAWELGPITDSGRAALTYDPFTSYIFFTGHHPGLPSWIGRSHAAGLRGTSTSIAGCGVGFNARGLELQKSKGRLRWAVHGILIHELGHCLGLGHAEAGSKRNWRAFTDEVPDYGIYPHKPVMIGGGYIAPRATYDDRVGASILRPAPEWLENTGSFHGRVLLEDGDEASYVHVLANRLRVDGTIAESVGVLTDEEGGFRFHALDPGRYLVVIRAVQWTPHHNLVGRATIDVRDTFLTRPVVIARGRETKPISIVARRGPVRTRGAGKER